MAEDIDMTTLLHARADRVELDSGRPAMRIGKHAKPVLGDPNGGLALAVLGGILAATSGIAVLGKVVFGEVGAYVGGGLYIVVASVACTVMTVRDVRAHEFPCERAA